MINQDLINRVTVYLANEKPLKPELARELLDSYISLIEQNADLHKELVKYKRGTLIDSATCELPPSNLAM